MNESEQPGDHHKKRSTPRYPVTVTIDNFRSKTTQASNAAKFEALFQEHWARVYGVAFRIIGDPDEAEDLALEAFLKLHTKMENTGGLKFLRRKTSLSGWLYRVATNLSLNELRSQKRRKEYEREAGRLSMESSGLDNPAVAVEQVEESYRVRKILSQMKGRSAKMLILRHSGLTYAEIAEAVKVSPNSVGKLLSRAEQDFERRYRALEGK